MDKKKIIASLAYKFIERLSVKGLGLVISIVLARMLAPEQFGQIAILNVFVNLSQVIVEGGFTTALIQRKDVTEQDYSTVFFINVGLAIICYFCLQIAAPWISEYYSLEITKPLQIYSITVFFSAFNSLQLARLQKRMEFKKIMGCNLIATIFSGIAGIWGAYRQLGLWALILYYMMNCVIMCITTICVEKWLPKLDFSLYRARILFNYGWKIFVSRSLCSLYGDIRSLIIGKQFSENDLAYYNRGQQFPQVISHTLDSAIHSVMLPTMSTVQDEKQKLAELLRSAETMGAYIIIPTMLGLAAVSEPVVRLLLTEKWLPCVPYMQWLCIANAAVPIVSTNLIALMASGRSDIYMRLEMIRRVVMLAILVIVILAFQSVEAIAISYCISNWLDALICIVPAKKMLGYGVKEQLADLWKILLTSFIMFAVVQTMNMLQWNSVVLVIMQIFVGVVVYLGIGSLLKVQSQTVIVKQLTRMLGGKR